MTSAAELFYTRRSRFGRDSCNGPDLVCDSSSERSVHRRRRDSEGCDHVHRSRHALNRLFYSDRELVRRNEGISHPASDNIVNSEVLSGMPRFSGHDRLPGSVLLAKERLIHRLRGVPLSENRQRRETSSARQNRPVTHTRVAVEAEDPETGIPPELSTGKHKPPGLTQGALNSLHNEVFRTIGKAASSASLDCSICLESFKDGDRLIRLQCEHRFHSPCLDPWIRRCGDCPYCRRRIHSAVTERSCSPQ